MMKSDLINFNQHHKTVYCYFNQKIFGYLGSSHIPIDNDVAHSFRVFMGL